MKPLTKKQRREIYLKVARFIDESETDEFICNELKKETEYGLLSAFIEFELFFPVDNQHKDLAFFSFNTIGDALKNKVELTTKEANNRRVIAMLLCAEMTKP